MFKASRFWIGLGVSLVFLFLFFRSVNFGDLGKALGAANYLFVVPAIAVYFVAVFFRTLRWQYLLSPVRKFFVVRLFPVVVIGYMANNLLPVRLGELVRSYYISDREKFSASTALATIIVERLYDGLTLLFFVAVVAPFLPLMGVVKGLEESSGIPWVVLVTVTGAVFVVAITFLSLLAAFSRLHVLAYWMVRAFPTKLQPKVKEPVTLFLHGLDVLRSPQRHLGLFVLSLPVWLFEGSMYFLIALSFNLHGFTNLQLLIPIMLLVTSISNLATSLPSSQGSIGPFEFFAAATLSTVLVGVSDETAKAYALALHVILLVPVTLLGLIFIWWQNLSLYQLAKGTSGRTSLPQRSPKGLSTDRSE